MDTTHGEGTTSTAVAAGKRRFHTTFKDGAECVEEFDLRSNEITSRRWRQKTVLGVDGPWEVEIGDPPSASSAGGGGGGDAASMFGGMSLSASSTNPVFCPREVREAWEWRVRNLPYPTETYSVTLDEEKDQLVLRTTNRKYFKRFHVPALRRLGLTLEQPAVSFDHSGTTLVIQYEKPDEVIEAEAALRVTRQKEAAKGVGAKEGAAPDCKQQ